MRRLIVFNHVTLDGFFADARGDMSWAHPSRADAEWSAFVSENAGSGGLLVFGRITYELMAGYWPTPMASQNAPVVAERINALPKVVFSRKLERASWNNTTLYKDGLADRIRRLKSEPGEHITILGSGSLVSQLAPEALIDEYRIVVNPIVLGRGKSMFDGLPAPLPLERTGARSFANGKVLLTFEPRT